MKNVPEMVRITFLKITVSVSGEIVFQIICQKVTASVSQVRIPRFISSYRKNVCWTSILQVAVTASDTNDFQIKYWYHPHRNNYKRKK